MILCEVCVLAVRRDISQAVHAFGVWQT